MAAVEGVPLLMRVVSSAVAVSRRAAQIVRDVMKKGELGIVEKGKNDLQTEADRSAQRCIVASLHKQFPDISIFGEEQLSPTEKIPADFYELGFDEEVLKHKCPARFETVESKDVVIWVDPLDGTAEYTQGLLDHVTVLIGVAVRGRAAAGIINQPYYNYLAGPDAVLGRCIWGVIGLGSFGFVRGTLPEGNIITTTRSHSDRIITETVNACEPSEILRVGGAGHKVLLLIENKAHAYVFASKGCKKWDTCAPEAVLHALGGNLTDIHGNPIYYHAEVSRPNTGGVLATVANHKSYLDKIPDYVKDNFETCVPQSQASEQTVAAGDSQSAKEDSHKPTSETTSANSTPSPPHKVQILEEQTTKQKQEQEKPEDLTTKL